MATATRTARPISPAQIKFVKSLLDQRDVPAELVQAMGDWENEFTTRNASTTIDLLKSLPWAPKADEAPADELADEPGMYEVDGKISTSSRTRRRPMFTRWSWSATSMFMPVDPQEQDHQGSTGSRSSAP